MSTNKFDEKTLIGQTFGDYTILDAYRTNPGNKIRVLCRCVCGWQGNTIMGSKNMTNAA